MIAIEQLRYVRLGTGDLPGAVHFAERIIGLQLVERTEHLAFFRSDYRDHTLVFVAGSDEQSVGLEVRDPAALDAAEQRLGEAGHEVQRGDAAACAERKVKALLTVHDPSGNRFELVVRPVHSGWRYFPPRDAGMTGLAAVALRSAKPAEDERFWTGLFNGKVSDWVGDAAFIRFDRAHHRLAYHPSSAPGVLAVEFGVESVNQLMQNSYFLANSQVKIMHGPGRRPTSEHMFLTFRGPEDRLYSYLAEGAEIAEPPRRPRQFARTRSSFCAWGSESEIPEFQC